MTKIFKIVKDNKKSIRIPSTPIEESYKDRYIKLGQDMVEYLRMSQDDNFAELANIKSGIGLAAPQIGINKNLIAIYIPTYDSSDKQTGCYQYALINPQIVEESVTMCALNGGEGCLSVDGEHPGFVYRNSRVKVKAYDILTKQNVEIVATGILSICLQHEIDH